MIKTPLAKYAKSALLLSILLLICLTAWYYHGREKARNETQTVRFEFAQYILNQKLASLEVSSQTKDKIEKVETDAKETQKQDQQTITTLESELGNAHADNERMRDQLEAARIRISNSATATRECKAALDTARVYSELYGKCITEYSKMATNAQKSRTAGITCEKAYSAIIESLNQR